MNDVDERLGTDAQGRAIYACAECGTREGAPYTQHNDDGKHRCRECAPKHDAARRQRTASLELTAAALAACLHPSEVRLTAVRGQVFVICELCGAASRDNGRSWKWPRLVEALTQAVRS